MKKWVGFFLLWVQVSPAQAFSWQALWYNANQRGQYWLAHHQPAKAAEYFTQPAWQGAAWYRAGQYQKAVKAFQGEPYNQGNALAHLGQYQAAILAYEKALAKNPNHKDAKFNRDVLKKLLNQSPKPKAKNRNKDKDKDKDKTKTSRVNLPKPLTTQQRQVKRLLNRVPDDPGGLLRQKFLRDYLRRQS